MKEGWVHADDLIELYGALGGVGGLSMNILILAPEVTISKGQKRKQCYPGLSLQNTMKFGHKQDSSQIANSRHCTTDSITTAHHSLILEQPVLLRHSHMYTYKTWQLNTIESHRAWLPIVMGWMWGHVAHP